MQSHLSWRERSSDSLPTTCPQPFFDFGGVHVVVVYPAFIAGIVGRVNVDARDFAFVFGQKRLESFEIIAVNDFIAAAAWGGSVFLVLSVAVVRIRMVKDFEWNVAVMIQNVFFTNPVECRHEE